MKHQRTPSAWLGTDPGASALTRSTVWSMEIGQHIIALLLTTVGVVRALGEGASPSAVVIVAVVFIGWDVAGATLHPAVGTSSRAQIWLIGLAAIWLVAVAISAEFVWLAFLLWLLAGRLLPLVWGLIFSALVLAIVIAAPIYQSGTTSYADILGPLIGGVFAFGISRGYLQLLNEGDRRENLVASLTSAQAEMAELQDELARAQRESGAAAERIRIGRDLHDTVAQALSSIRFLAHAGSAQGDPEAVVTFAQIGALAGDSLTDVRRIVAALAPAELDQGALADALARLLARTEDQSRITTRLQVDESLPYLPTEVEVALLRTAQSALANVRKHSGATTVVMSLIDDEDSVRLDLVDDGRGFDVLGWEADAQTPQSSYGLRFMRERLRELGGGLDIESGPGEGTAISAHVPLRFLNEDGE